MDGTSARETAGAWVRAHGNAVQDAQGAYEYLVRELMSLVPDQADSGVVLVDGRPAVAAADDRSLVQIQASAENGEATVSCRRIALQPPPGIRLRERVRFDEAATLREREWTVTPPDGQALTLTTEERLQSQFRSDQGPSQGELAMRRFVRAAGWSLPDPDPGAREYQ
jgi:hypothetical protein